MWYDAKLDDLMWVKVNDNWEILMPINDHRILCKYVAWNNDMEWVCWWKIFVRKTVSEMLSKIQDTLSKYNENYSLHVTYWYRSLEIQEKRFKMRMKTLEIEEWIQWDELLRITHETVAHPLVAWHPTWWAVDLLIWDNKLKCDLDFWSRIYDYSNNEYIYNAFQDKDDMIEQHNNRVLLRELMVEGWFIPYDLEFWHFSYWDKEWWFHSNSNALYDQLRIDSFI